MNKKISYLKSYAKDFLIQTILKFRFTKNKNFNKIEKIDKIKLNVPKAKHWALSSKILINNIRLYGVNFFLRFNIIQGTMFLNDESLSEKILKKKIIKKYRSILNENSFGYPVLSKKYKFTSINKMHQLHHLLFFKDKIKKNLKIKNILEIGAGYGLLSSIALKILKPKKITIFDLEIFIFLQKVYLGNIINNFLMHKFNFHNNLTSLRVSQKKFRPNLTFAMWSLSEMPIKLRENLIPIIFDSDFILIGYQEKFENINNLAYFKNLQKKKLNYKFQNIKVPYLKNNFYLFAEKIKNINEKKYK